ncbi:MAG TPA: 2-succinyl-5-enolpyruvyl-6-hydroxy-3-cyclohexene-1-carboxylic-acid synthase [Dermatophilaceae bacterium]|nr:2-succinyl-5-enolpyruvyl-6-hydroxy-3-cyclohexene-1-carboxylic-acid synthase [Dermatophilaceae bacterium]
MDSATTLAGVVVDELCRHGVREAVLCPGSRSAPLAYALQRADREGRLRLHVRVDERAAGFLALGMAKLTRRVVPVVTTSGTAVANLHPALLEAAHAGVPLLVLSADRPAELQGTGANQTTRQDHLFGDAPRLTARLTASAGHASWRSAVGRAVAAAVGAPGGDPGPVHVNVALREPLVPELGAPQPLPGGRPEQRPWVSVVPPAGSAEPLGDVARTVVLLGDLPDPAGAVEVVAMARRRSWPLVAEPFGAGDRAGVLGHGSLLLTAAGWLDRQLPDRVVVAGRPTLSRAAWALLRRKQVRVEVVSAMSTWTDPTGLAAAVHPWAAIQATGHVPGDPAWSGAWSAAGDRVTAAVSPEIALSWPSGPAVAHQLLTRMPPGATLFVGSSNPARDVELALVPAHLPSGLTVVANRGLAGIDGCLSTAAGIALTRADTYALVGDLTFLHDTNGLLIGPGEPRPDLTVVVVNDDGGGIFTTLEPGEPERAADFERIFGTPTGASIGDICRAFGVRHEIAVSASDLARAVSQRPCGVTIVEVRVDRAAHRDLRTRLRAVAAAAAAAG